MKKRYYSVSEFRKLDQTLLKNYKRLSPYTLSRDYLKKENATDIYTYGETPLTTFETIVQACEIKQGDTLIEMGAGRGRGALFLATHYGIQVTAFERIQAFLEKCPKHPYLHFENGNMFSADFSKASAIYLYGTLLSDSEILHLAALFPKNAKIITVSYPLNDYSDHYQTIKSFTGRFPWGKTEIYWNERIS